MRRGIDRREFLKATAATGGVWMAGASSLGFAQGEKMVELPKPQTDSGKPLMQVLQQKKTAREFAPDKLPPRLHYFTPKSAILAGKGDNGVAISPLSTLEVNSIVFKSCSPTWLNKYLNL